MNGCRYIKQRIEEADKPDLLPFEVSEHIGQCSDCERFAFERTALRKLVAAGTRVSAPINFDAMLKARLAERKARPAFWWLGSPAFLRLGAATAGIVVMVFVAQYAGLFSSNQTIAPSSAGEVASGPRAPEVTPKGVLPYEVGPAPGAGPSIGHSTPIPYRTPRVRRGDVLVDGAVPAGYMTAEDGGVVLVRGRNGDMDVQMPTVSVGAQPLLYVSAGQRTVRSVGTSF